ncbi:LTA synthase family protein [Fervidibacillus halotolerans]|uniref:Sulfatase-like hydrolase/transferase n=1 Tax=Fervidibacillus halotolerans TaxID=2980027 RepID=A0A9E8LYS2_9BACI|nr:alkaline phosphatase family protein [Fervidibacillus halotolerans]WAA12248.1 sulfatase-like hydrolase/transferase [Fervidibacillus halotolerans]
MNDRWKMSGFFFYFLLSFLYMEGLLKFALGKPLFSFHTILIVLFSTFYALLCFFFINLFPKKGMVKLSVLIFIILGIVFSSQFIYFSFFKTYYSFYSAKNAGQITQFWQDILLSLWHNLFWIILFFLPAIVFIPFGKRKFTYPKLSFIVKFSILSSASVFYISSILFIHFSGRQLNSIYDLYYQNNYPNLSVSKLGLLTTMRLDLQRQLTNWSPTLTKPISFNTDSKSNVPKKGENGSTIEKEGEKTDLDLPKDVIDEPQILNIDFDYLIANENNAEIKKMHQYFSAVQPTYKNAYTGKFSGYNLIFITAEGFSPLGVHKDVTPTLYKLVHEGYQFTNFYTPIWGVSTSDGEYVATVGLIPKSGVWSFYESSKNELPFALGNQLKKLGYKTVAYHNHTYDYYRRDVSHPNMGYDYKGVGNGLKVKETWPESDLEMMEVTIPEYIDNEPFHAYYMTVSGHLRYSFTGNYIAYKNKKYVENLPYSDEGKAYIATQVELDRALEYLLNELKKRGIADRTLIALSADHYPYGLKKKTIDELAGHKVEENFELYKNHFILYTEGMEEVVVNQPASSLDIIPTLSNLLGLPYDSRLLMGRDLFSNSEPLVIFQNRSFITAQGKYNSITNTFYPANNDNPMEDYVKRISTIVNEKFYYSAKILDTDYYSIILKALDRE